MIPSNNIKSLQIEKTLSYVEGHSYLFFIQWSPSTSKKTSEFKKKLQKIEDTFSFLQVKNSIVTQINLKSLPLLEGPNLFLGGNDLSKAGKVYAFLKSTPHLIILGASIENEMYNHLELKTYFESIYNQNVYSKLLAGLHYNLSIHTQLGLLDTFRTFQYVALSPRNIEQK